MQRNILFISIILSLFFVSCTEDKFIQADPQMVVEGWIDEGGYPIVILSQIIPVSDNEIYLDELRDYVITWGKVTISDGENKVVLTGKRNNDYYPPYIYTTSKLRGEAGKTYYLTAEYKNFFATAKTTIPSKTKVEKFVTGYENGSYCINAIIDDNPNENNYYKFFMKVGGRDSCYLSSNYAIVNDKDYSFPCSIPLEIGRSDFYDKNNRQYSISEKDSIFIKFAQIDSISYNIWNDYKNILELSQNSFTRYSTSIRSNISGGLGYWVGYGATEYLLRPDRHDKPVIFQRR